MTTKQSWEEKFKTFCSENQWSTRVDPILLPDDKVLAFLSQLIAEERAKVFEEERRFILNVLDGIDVADYQMQNKGGGTNAIRFALASRVSPHHQ